MDIYQGSIGTISPAVGNYTLQTYITIDKPDAGAIGSFGTTGMGVTGTGTLESVLWDVGVTGIQASQFTNAKHGF